MGTFMRHLLSIVVAAFVLSIASAAWAQEAPITLYENNAGTVSASVQQIVPVGGAGNQYQSSTSTYANVSRVVMTRDIFMIYWQNSALTILPKQYVVNITINRQTARE